MWLVLCGSGDLSALWAYQGMRMHGLDPVELVTSDQLLFNRRCAHRIGAYGVSIEITLRDGRTINNVSTKGTLNRLVSFSQDGLVTGHPDDREYAAQEQFAFFLSWLTALPSPILNQPTPQGLSGRWRHTTEWIWLAHRAGLPVGPYHQSARSLASTPIAVYPSSTAMSEGRSVIVIGSSVVGTDIPNDLADGCLKLAALAETPLLGIEFEVDRNGARRFINATPWPDLRLGGDQVLHALVAALHG